MEIVENLHHFDSLVKEIKSSGEKITTNCYLLPDGITNITEQNHLYWERNKNRLLFFHEKQDYYNVYFYFVKDKNIFTPIDLQKLDKPITIDLIYIESRITKTLEEIKEFWINNGFSIFTHYRQTSMDNPVKEDMPDLPIHLDNDLYRITHVTPQQYQEIQKLWRSNLGVYSAMLPFADELIELLRNKQVYCVLDREDQIVATQQFQRSGKTCLLSRFVCEESHRRHGLVKALLHTCFNTNKDVKKYLSWVDEKNSAAKLFHKSIGLTYDGRVSCQMILE